MKSLVAIIGAREGRGVDYVRASYRRRFQHGEEKILSANLALAQGFLAIAQEG